MFNEVLVFMDEHNNNRLFTRFVKTFRRAYYQFGKKDNSKDVYLVTKYTEFPCLIQNQLLAPCLYYVDDMDKKQLDYKDLYEPI